MKAKRLAEMLLRTPDAEVLAWDADAEGWYPITGLVGDQHKQEVQTDSDEEPPFHCDERLGDRCKTQCKTCQEWQQAKRKVKP